MGPSMSPIAPIMLASSSSWGRSNAVKYAAKTEQKTKRKKSDERKKQKRNKKRAVGPLEEEITSLPSQVESNEAVCVGGGGGGLSVFVYTK